MEKEHWPGNQTIEFIGGMRFTCKIKNWLIEISKADFNGKKPGY